MAKRDKKKAGLQKKVSSVFKNVSIPKSDDDLQTDETSASVGAADASSESARKDDLILQSSLLKKLLRPENSPDKDEPERAVAVPPQKTVPDHPISEHPREEKTLPASDLSDKMRPDRSVSTSSSMKAPAYAETQNPSINEPVPSEDSSAQKDSDVHDQVGPRLRDESIPQLASTEDTKQAKNDSDKVIPSRKNWVPPKLTTPDLPVSAFSSLTKKPEAADRQNNTEPGQAEVGEPQKQAVAKNPASQSPVTRDLHPDKSTSNPPPPGHRVATPSTLKSADPQSLQNAKSKKRYGFESLTKETASFRQPKTTVTAAATGPSLWQQINNRLFAPKPGVSSAKQKAMVLSIPILAIIMIFAFRQVLRQSPREAKGADGQDVTPVADTHSGHEIDWKIPDLIPATLRDPAKLPFQKIEEPNQTPDVPETQPIHLGAIVYSQNQSSAVVNGQITHVGDVVNGATILKINSDSVEFEQNGKKWILKVSN